MFSTVNFIIVFKSVSSIPILRAFQYLYFLDKSGVLKSSVINAFISMSS